MTYVDITKQSPVILSLCPGIRGLERGVQRVFRDVRVAAYVEIETFIVENLLSAMESGMVDAAPVWTNLKTFNPEPFRGKIDILLGGYPCQPFSLAGNRVGADDPRHLYPYIESAIGTIRPFCCFFENVSGHLSMGFQQVQESLRNMGYRVEAGIYTAEEVGATHERERLFILAILEDTNGYGSRRDNEGGFQSETIRAGEELGNTGYESLEGGSVGVRIIEEGWKESVRSIDEPSGSSIVGDTASIHQWDERNKSRESKGPYRRSGDSKMAHNDHGRNEQYFEKEWETCKPVTRRDEMSNTNNDGSNESEDRQGHPSGNDGDPSRSNKLFESERFSRKRENDRFPAGQGSHQYEWEEPRIFGPTNRLPNSLRKLWRTGRKGFEKIMGTEEWSKTERIIKAKTQSSLEYSIDGYDFTEDLHRAIGNSVVEQTSELAFRDLWNKLFPNNKI